VCLTPLTINTAPMPFRFSKPAATSEDILNQLVNYDVVILVDDSGSMSGKRWKQVRNIFLSTVTGADDLCIRRSGF